MKQFQLQIYTTDEFDRWMAQLKDRRAVARIAVRLDRLQHGNPGNVRGVGSGVSELKIDYGPGYRVYYIQRGFRLIVLLCGGDKSTQDEDIVTAKNLAKLVEEDLK